MNPRPSTRSITTAQGLVDAGLAPQGNLGAMTEVAASFRIRLTPAMREAATTAEADPIAAQFVPDARELTIRPEELWDPIGDEAHSPVPGLTHRYPDRVILHVTRTCEVYCRFCFRREVVGEEGSLPPEDLDRALDYIARTPAIHEVILTGGDPMVLSARRMGRSSRQRHRSAGRAAMSSLLTARPSAGRSYRTSSGRPAPDRPCSRSAS